MVPLHLIWTRPCRASPVDLVHSSIRFLACSPADATSLPERPCFRCGHGLSQDVLWTSIDNDESEASGSAVAAARIISLHRTHLKRPSQMH